MAGVATYAAKTRSRLLSRFKPSGAAAYSQPPIYLLFCIFRVMGGCIWAEEEEEQLLLPAASAAAAVWNGRRRRVPIDRSPPLGVLSLSLIVRRRSSSSCFLASFLPFVFLLYFFPPLFPIVPILLAVWLGFFLQYYDDDNDGTLSTVLCSTEIEQQQQQRQQSTGCLPLSSLSCRTCTCT